mmetsp:Transcript_62322/g.115669  ORF Transcript_62322/g.115669 Transcript_62322/m.115669 type:complete len:435 (+) Transcript_62322:110-1414(+)
MSEEAGQDAVDDAPVGNALLSDFAERMRIKSSDDDRTVLSKKLSFVLRHGAKQLDLEIDENGYIDVNELLALEELFKDVTLDALREVVQQSNVDKQRYELLEDGGKCVIRATGKHTMQGLAGSASKDKRGKRSQSKEEAPPGDRPAPSSPPQISEEEFCQKWKLDKWARQRLTELPSASRQLAMRKFNPEEDVPQTDYPKLFVAFCKRFRAKGGGREQSDAKGSPSQRPQTPPDDVGSPPRRMMPESHALDAQQKQPLPKPQPAPRPQYTAPQPVQQFPPPPQAMPVAPRGGAYQHPPPPPDHAPAMQAYTHQGGPPLATPGVASCRDGQMQWGWQQQMRQPASHMQQQQRGGSSYEEQYSYSQPMMSDQRDAGHQGWGYGGNQWNQWQPAPRAPARMDASSRKYGGYSQNNMSQYSQPGYYNPQPGWGYGSGA